MRNESTVPKILKIENLVTCEPLTDNQKVAFDSWKKGNHLVMQGSAGTGKTFMAMYFALLQVLDKQTPYEYVNIIRSVVPTRDIGFMPGSYEEKLELYTGPYKKISAELFQCGDAWTKLLENHSIRFESTSYLRGLTYNNGIVIVDECQNMTFHELDSIMGRIGRDCRIIFCGDFYQSDLKRDSERKEHLQFQSILELLRNFDVIEFGWQDIVRSDFVRDYIMTKEMKSRDESPIKQMSLDQ